MKRKGKCLLGFLLCLMFLSSCSAAKTDETYSPVLEDIFVDTSNNGTEDSQYVEIYFQFDKNISIKNEADENMKITIAEERMEPENFTAEGSVLHFRIPVTAITRGNLVIEEEKEGNGYPGIMDESGKYRAVSFAVDMLIPSDISLEDVEDYTGKGFQKKIIGTWKIRNITWLLFTEDGVPVPSQLDTYLDNMDDAVALHGHDFLLCDETMIAEDMAETLNNHFGNQYIFRQEGDTVIGERLDGSLDTELDLNIYEYKEVTYPQE